MKYQLTRGEKGKVEIEANIDKLAFVEAYEDILAKHKDTTVAGFRPGKVPKDVLEEHLGVNKLLNESANLLVSTTLGEIFTKEKIIPLGSPSIAVEALSKDSPFVFRATLTAKPQVKIGDWKKIKVKRVTAKAVGDRDVDESIKNIYEAWGKQKGTEGSEDSEGLEGAEGAGDAEEKTGKFIYDARGEKIFIKDDKSDTKQVTSDTKDEIDDNFAKKIGARDLAHLKELVRKDLEQIVTDQIEAKLEQEVFDEILKLSDIDVPDILVDDELNRILVRLNQQLESQNKKLEDYLKEENTTFDALKAKWRPQAEKNVKVTLILDKVGRNEKVQVSDAEVENALANVNQTSLSAEQKEDLKNYLKVSIYQVKTLDLVKKAVAS